MGTAFRIQADDLAVQYRFVFQVAVNGRSEIEEPFVRVPFPRDQARFIAVHVCQRPKPANLQLEDEIGVVERLGKAV